MSYTPADEFVYVIAGGETLETINSLKAKAEAAKKDLEQWAQDIGATVTFNGIRPDFHFSGKPAQGWARQETRSGPFFGPDEETDEGYRVRMDISSRTARLDVQSAFNKACANACGGSSGYGNYEFEELGDKTIVRIPMTSAKGNEYFVPPASTVIPCSEYIKLKEEARPKARTLRPFGKPLAG